MGPTHTLCSLIPLILVAGGGEGLRWLQATLREVRERDRTLRQLGQDREAARGGGEYTNTQSWAMGMR